jgi:release factor glutamine methyltransferase
MNKLIDILNWSEEYLKKYSFSKPRLEAEKVLAHVLGYERIALYAYFDRPLENEEKDEVKRYLKEMTSKNLGFEKVLKNSTDKNISGSDIENHQNSNMELLEKSCEYLEKHGIANSRIETEYIFAHVLGCKRMMLKLNFSKKLSDDEKESIRKLLLDRVKKENLCSIFWDTRNFLGIGLM